MRRKTGLNYVKVISMKQTIVPFLAITFIICLVIFSETAVTSAHNGIKLWLNIVFPSLFPFFVASGLLGRSGIVKKYGKLLEPLMRPIFNVPGCGSFPLVMGITSGYPIGAKLTADLRKEGLVTVTEAERLLTFSNNSGPLFIIGAVAIGMFNNPRLGLLLLLTHIMAGITVGIIFRNYKGSKNGGSNKSFSKVKQRTMKPYAVHDENIGRMLGDVVKNSVMTLLAIGGYIIFFSVLINLLIETKIILGLSRLISLMLFPVNIDQSIIESVLGGFIEVTTGVSKVSSLQVDLFKQLPAAALVIGWAGISVHSQVAGIISDTDISMKPYLVGKLLQGLISAIYTYIIIRFFDNTLLLDRSVFANVYAPMSFYWQETLQASCRYLGYALMILGILASVNKRGMYR